MPSSNADDAKVDGASRRRFRSLKGRSQFKAVYEHGSRSRSGGLTVIALRDHRIPEIGIVASRKSVGGAVARNRARRRVRAALDDVPLTEGGYIVIATRAVLTARFGDLVRWLETAMKEERE